MISSQRHGRAPAFTLRRSFRSLEIVVGPSPPTLLSAQGARAGNRCGTVPAMDLERLVAHKIFQFLGASHEADSRVPSGNCGRVSVQGMQHFR